MVVLGIDAHKRTHTVVAVNEHGRPLGRKTVRTTTADHLALLRRAQQFAGPRSWAVEDCLHLSRRLERDLLAAGESIVRVPPKLMAKARDSARTFGKSDPIDAALAVARAALREPNLPTARLDGPDREVRLLVDHRESLVAERTRLISRLRWHLHELDPAWEPGARSLDRASAYDKAEDHITGLDGVVARLARALLQRAARADRGHRRARRGDQHPNPAACPLAAGHPRLWAADRGEDPRRDRRCRPVQIPQRLRPLQRHRAAAGLVIQPPAAPAQPGRQPPAQRRAATHRSHPSTLAPTGAGDDDPTQGHGDGGLEALRVL